MMALVASLEHLASEFRRQNLKLEIQLNLIPPSKVMCHRFDITSFANSQFIKQTCLFKSKIPLRHTSMTFLIHFEMKTIKNTTKSGCFDRCCAKA